MAEISPQEFLKQVASGMAFQRADLSEIQLEGAVLPRANLARSDLTGANLTGADLRGADLSSASLREAYLAGALLEGAKLKNADLEGANLSGADLKDADLSRVNFEGSTLEGAKLIGARVQNAIFTDANLGKADLSNANLKNADFSDAYLGGAALRNADLRKGALEGTNLEEADLSGADLRECDCAQAIFDGTILEGTKVYGIAITPEQLTKALTTWIDVSRSGDGSAREEGDAVGGFLTGGAPARAPAPAAVAAGDSATRYFGPGDVMRNADMEFGEGSVVDVEGTFEKCKLALADGARLTVGPSGVVRDCQITGRGSVHIRGQLLSGGDGIVITAREFVVGATGYAVATILQPDDLTAFSFEPGCILRLSIQR